MFRLLKPVLNWLPVVVLFFSCNTGAQQTNLGVEAFEKGIAQTGIQVLDVRTAGEYQSGHLKNALLANWNDQDEFIERTKSLDKSKPVYTYCLGGVRSSSAAEWLNKNGYKAYSLQGGINAWRGAGKPVEQDVEVAQLTMADYLAKIPADKTVLVDFSAVWCPPCKKMAPVLDTLVAKEGSHFELLKIDGGQQFSICKELGIEGFPSFLLYKQGKMVWKKQGIVSLEEFTRQLQ